MTISAVTANFTRPNDVTPYTANDLVADTTTAANVAALLYNLVSFRGKGGKIVGAKVRKSGATVTLATFTLHLFSAAQVHSQGDNGAFTIANMNGYLGSIPVDLASGAAVLAGANGAAKKFAAAAPIYVPSTVGAVYGYLQATAAYVPAAQEVFEVALDLET